MKGQEALSSDRRSRRSQETAKGWLAASAVSWAKAVRMPPRPAGRVHFMDRMIRLLTDHGGIQPDKGPVADDGAVEKSSYAPVDLLA